MAGHRIVWDTLLGCPRDIIYQNTSTCNRLLGPAINAIHGTIRRSVNVILGDSVKSDQEYWPEQGLLGLDVLTHYRIYPLLDTQSAEMSRTECLFVC